MWGRRAFNLRGVQLLSVFLLGDLRVASYPDILCTCHTIQGSKLRLTGRHCDQKLFTGDLCFVPLFVPLFLAQVNNVSTESIHLFFAVKALNIPLPHWKTSKWPLCSKTPYNALQTLAHWVYHVCLWIVSSIWFYDLEPKKLHLATIFYAYSPNGLFQFQALCWRFFRPLKSDIIKRLVFHEFF